MVLFRCLQDGLRRMNRRCFLASFIAALAGAATAWPGHAVTGNFGTFTMAPPAETPSRPSTPEAADDEALRDYLHKMRRFDEPHPADIILSAEKMAIALSVTRRLARVQSVIGHGHFQSIGIDDARAYGRSRSDIGAFTAPETTFLEELFHADAAKYGFNDIKPLTSFTFRIRKTDLVKAPGSGNFIFRGEPETLWQTIRRSLGSSVILTSGVRGVAKQFFLFLNKAMKFDGNLSLASRSLAPPGYSFHGIGDFDVGQKGFGGANFSEKFVETPVFRDLCERGYLSLRYPAENLLGVRYEPWHVRVAQL